MTESEATEPTVPLEPATPASTARTDPAPARRRRKRRLWIIGSAAVLVICLAGSSIWFFTRAGASSVSRTREVQASLETLTSSIGATGTIQPAQRLDLSFSGSGEVTSVLVDVGDTVSVGSPLATIDTTDLSADVEAAAADADAAYDDWVSAKSSGTDAQITAARSSYRVKVKALEDARKALSAATLTSTIDGTVATVNISVGDTVGSSAGGSSTGSSAGGSTGTQSGSSSGSSSSAAITVISTDSYVVTTSVGSADLAHVTKGLQAEITPTSGTETLYGTVTSVGVMAESSTSGTTASFPVTIKVTGTPEGLYAGASASVQIIYSKRADVLTVPTAAISSNTSGQSVVTVKKDGQEVETVVETGASSGNVTEITSGLSEGDTVLVTQRSVAVSESGSGSSAQPGTNAGGGGAMPDLGSGGGPAGGPPNGGGSR